MVGAPPGLGWHVSGRHGCRGPGADRMGTLGRWCGAISDPVCPRRNFAGGRRPGRRQPRYPRTAVGPRLHLRGAGERVRPGSEVWREFHLGREEDRPQAGRHGSGDRKALGRGPQGAGERAARSRRDSRSHRQRLPPSGRGGKEEGHDHDAAAGARRAPGVGRYTARSGQRASRPAALSLHPLAAQPSGEIHPAGGTGADRAGAPVFSLDRTSHHRRVSMVLSPHGKGGEGCDRAAQTGNGRGRPADASRRSRPV